MRVDLLNFRFELVVFGGRRHFWEEILNCIACEWEGGFRRGSLLVLPFGCSRVLDVCVDCYVFSLVIDGDQPGGEERHIM